MAPPSRETSMCRQWWEPRGGVRSRSNATRRSYRGIERRPLGGRIDGGARRGKPATSSRSENPLAMIYSRRRRSGSSSILACRCCCIVVALVSVLTVGAHAQRETDEAMASEPQKGGESKAQLDEELFKKLFAQRRKDHIEAVQTLLKMDNYERLYKMITMLAEKVVEVVESSKSVIEKAGFLPKNGSFPEDGGIKDALSNILENTALFGDIILHLPDIAHRVLKAQHGWNSTICWALNFANQTRHLLDKSTITMIGLVAQELNVTERDPSYFNPYRTHAGKREDAAEEKKKKKKRDKRKKGPRIAKIEL